jgi:hypothetical protein
VGSGNSSIALTLTLVKAKSEADKEANKINKKEKEVFKVMECGSSGSQLADMEKVLIGRREEEDQRPGMHILSCRCFDGGCSTSSVVPLSEQAVRVRMDL